VNVETVGGERVIAAKL